MKRREEMSLLERLYLLEIIKGVFLTTSRFLTNFGIYILNVFGFLKKKQPWATVEYPDAIRPYPPRYRGRHRLTLYPDGRIKCTACFLCATACPAKCIYIEPEEHANPKIEKVPKRYEIDTLLCVYCGYCVEACPVDAIRMDTGIHPEVYSPDPRCYIEDKETLMNRSRELEEKSADIVVEEHLQEIKQIEKCSCLNP